MVAAVLPIAEEMAASKERMEGPVVRLSCLVADPHPIVAGALEGLLRSHGFEVIGPVGDGEAAVALAAHSSPALALVDWRLPRRGGVELVGSILRAAPAAAVVIYARDTEHGLVSDALQAGARGVVLKAAPTSEVIRALETLLEGGTYVDPRLASLPATHADRPTPRELHTLRLLAQGLTTAQVAERLAISLETVRGHVKGAIRRLGASNRTQAIAIALRRGLIS
jgi:DNA-binding NarL/FixJ family response regulator